MTPTVRRVAAPAALTVALLAGCAAPAAVSGGAAPLEPVRTVAPATSPVAVAKAAPAKAKDGYAGKVRAYGDSVMLGAASALRSRLHAKVDAAVSRQSYTLLSIVRRDWSKGRIRGPVVIHTGTNGTVLSRDLVRTIRPIQKRHVVLLVNAKVNRSWVPGNNRIISQVDAKWRNVVLLDWHRLAGKHPSWLSGFHLNSLGAKKYAAAVASKLHR